jgi:hypothetical protein
MTRPRTLLSGLLAILALLVVGVSLASATATLDIYGDYADNRVIDGHYSASDLKAALEGAQGDTSYAGFADAVSDAYDRDILGLSVGSEPRGTREFGDSADSPSSSLLPEPRGPGARDQPPWPFLALSILAGALVITGAGSSIYRRARR